MGADGPTARADGQSAALSAVAKMAVVKMAGPKKIGAWFWAGFAASIAFCLWACSQSTQPAQDVPAARITGLTLTLLDPGLGTRGVRVAFEAEATEDGAGAGEAEFTGFEVFRSIAMITNDSLGDPIAAGLPADTPWVEIALPDTTPPYKVYFAVRAVKRMETGEKWYSEKVDIDSLAIQPAARIYRPAPGDTLVGNQAHLQVSIQSDQGIVLRQMWWHREGNTWMRGLEDCLPRNDCDTPRFGNVWVDDSLVLAPLGGGSTGNLGEPNALVCVHGAEIFAGRLAAMRQSLACSRFWRSRL